VSSPTLTDWHRKLLDPSRRGDDRVRVRLHGWRDLIVEAIVLYERDDGEGYAMANGREGTSSRADIEEAG
jgi:hypothetical protein